MTIKTFKDLKVWQKSHNLTLRIYKTTRRFPTDEKYGLISQLRRATASIPANIAEGFKKKSKKDYARFINMADTSLEEVKYFILLALDLNYLEREDYDDLMIRAEEIGRMLHGFHKSLTT